jgi:hypothetical protein
MVSDNARAWSRANTRYNQAVPSEEVSLLLSSCRPLLAASLAFFAVSSALGCHGREGTSSSNGAGSSGGPGTMPAGEVGMYPILFVTQVPFSGFDAVSSVFANHLANIESVPRGGDLYLRYPDGALRNLTKEAGFGADGFQGDSAIAVREPCVHWSGTKAVFGMLVGAPPVQFQEGTYTWQLYEVAGLAEGETAQITKVAQQPAGFNNVAPFYGTDDRILFTSDRPRSGEPQLYPQLDEYESTPTVTGIWSLDPVSGDLFLVNHASSGAFSPGIDSAGRIVFTNWDHLQRDQQADADNFEGGMYGSFDDADESAGAAESADSEIFPEPRTTMDPALGPNVTPHEFNQFFPWQINEDGSDLETVNHVGRHEFGGSYTDGSFENDPNLTYNQPLSFDANHLFSIADGGYLHLREDPTTPGTFYASVVREFATASGGELVKFTGDTSLEAEQMVVTGITAPSTLNITPECATPDPTNTGHYRNPLPLSDGSVVAVYTAETRQDLNEGTEASPHDRYDYHLTTLKPLAGYLAGGQPLNAPIEKTLTYYDPNVLVTFSGALWELDPVEVRPRAIPTRRVETLEAPEEQSIADAGVDETALRAWLTTQNLAIIVSRNVTTRDRADQQQPYNLHVPGGVQTVGKPGILYDVADMQLFQADQVRGYKTIPGRRVLARLMHDATNPSPAGAPPASVAIGLDGSMAAFVPARRAMSWQLTDPTGTPVVRERNWVSFAPGEIRSCPACHGINKEDQAGQPVVTNEPAAFTALLRAWKMTTMP